MNTSIDFVCVKHSTPYGCTTIDGEVTLVTFREGNARIVCYPSLDLSDYGEDTGKDHENFCNHLGMYFQYAIEEGTLWGDLHKLRWDYGKQASKENKSAYLLQLKEHLPCLHQITKQGGYDISHQVISYKLSPAT